MSKSYALPFHLAHKPLLAAPYTAYDGPYANKTDAHYLSIGRAQWAAHYEEDFSAKVFRHSGERWSRQSEELPLHRAIDLASMVVVALAADEKGVRLPARTFENQAEPLDLPLYGKLKLPLEVEERVRERLKALVRTLQTFHPELVSEALEAVELPPMMPALARENLLWLREMNGQAAWPILYMNVTDKRADSLDYYVDTYLVQHPNPYRGPSANLDVAYRSTYVKRRAMSIPGFEQLSPQAREELLVQLAHQAVAKYPSGQQTV